MQATARSTGVPFDGTFVLIVDPATNKADTTSISVPAGSEKWFQGVLAENGKIYCIPATAATVLVINPVTNTIDTSLWVSSGSRKWWGGVLAPNGKIYGIPHSYSAVLVIDPIANKVDFTTITVPVGDGKWTGGFVAASGKIFCVPASVDQRADHRPRAQHHRHDQHHRAVRGSCVGKRGAGPGPLSLEFHGLLRPVLIIDP